MSMIDTVRAAMVTAMKEHDKERKESLSMLLSALKNKQIDKREDLTEAEEFEVVKKEIKKAKETMELAPADREDIKEHPIIWKYFVSSRPFRSAGAFGSTAGVPSTWKMNFRSPSE